jgi:hypothetical protein
MHAIKTKGATLWVLLLIVMPFVLLPTASAWTAGDEAAIFGHTFDEEYWTNDSLYVQGTDANGSLTASFVHVGGFDAFLIAVNEFTANGTDMIAPYQLFGMHFITPGNQEVFIGAVFTFLLVHNESYGSNQLPDMGHDDAWYVVPLASDDTWPEYTPAVEPIPATKLDDNHYRFGMRYYNLTCRIVDANNPVLFLATLANPVLQVVISELTIEYDITIDATGEVHAETLYTIGQVKELMFNEVEYPPSDIIVDSMEISAVHFLTVFTSEYTVVGATSGNTIQSPTQTTPLDEDISIEVGTRGERAFDIGFGRQYALFNETSGIFEATGLTALNTLLAPRLTDLILVLWQAPLSAFLFAHMAYGLSAQIRNDYATVGEMALNATSAFTTQSWWYAVTFPTWGGLRVEQDPVYVAYTNLAMTGPQNLIIFGILIVGALAVVFLVARRR